MSLIAIKSLLKNNQYPNSVGNHFVSLVMSVLLMCDFHKRDITFCKQILMGDETSATVTQLGQMKTSIDETHPGS